MSSICVRCSALPPSLMSTPRPAMLVAIVTAPGAPASAIVCALALGVLGLGVEHRVRDARSCAGARTAARRPRPRSCRRARAGPCRGAPGSPRDRAPLALAGLVDLVVLVLADHRPVRGDLHHADLVDLHELRGLGQGRARHARELVVHAEVVLQRDRRERLVLLADAHALLGLDGLVQALRPAAAVQDAAGELVDDLDLAVDDGVVDVLLVERLGLQRLVQVVDQDAVLGAVEVVDAEEALGLRRRPAR